jgi:hypothetical protein
MRKCDNTVVVEKAQQLFTVLHSVIVTSPLCQSVIYIYIYTDCTHRHTHVGPCHHGMARPQVADGGTASDMEGSCE